MYCFINVKGYCSDFESMARNLTLSNKNDRYEGNYVNLRFIVEKTGQYTIKGSIWIFYHGNNKGDFTMTDFTEAVRELDSLTYGTFSNANLIAFEIGVNILVDHEPSYYLNLMSGSVVNERLKVLYRTWKKKRLWKVETQHCYKNLKVYSKSIESNDRHNNILRFEFVVKNVKCGLNKVLTIADLAKPEVYQDLVDELRYMVSGLIFKPNINRGELSKISNKRKYMILLASKMDLEDIYTFLEYTIDNRKTLYAERKILKSVYLARYINSPMDNIVKKVNDKLKSMSTYNRNT